MSRVFLVCCGSGGVVDVPGSSTQAGEPLLVYGHHHGGDNQVFLLQSDGLLSSALEPGLHLAVQGDLRVVTRRSEEARWSLQPLQSLTGGEAHTIRLLSSPGLVMTDRDGHLVVEEERDQSPEQSWRLLEATEEPEAAARPATSCHLRYHLPPEVETCADWELSCSVLVAASSPSSYFCVVGKTRPGQDWELFCCWQAGDRQGTRAYSRSRTPGGSPSSLCGMRGSTGWSWWTRGRRSRLTTSEVKILL